LIFGGDYGKMEYTKPLNNITPLNMDLENIKIKDLEKKIHHLMDCL